MPYLEIFARNTGHALKGLPRKVAIDGNHRSCCFTENLVLICLIYCFPDTSIQTHLFIFVEFHFRLIYADLIMQALMSAIVMKMFWKSLNFRINHQPTKKLSVKSV